jgi:hypothetical protein
MISLGEIVGCDLPFPHGICLPGYGAGILLPEGANYVPDPVIEAQSMSGAIEQAEPGPIPCGMAALGGLGALAQAIQQTAATGACDYYTWGQVACDTAQRAVSGGAPPAAGEQATTPTASAGIWIAAALVLALALMGGDGR